MIKTLLIKWSKSVYTGFIQFPSTAGDSLVKRYSAPKTLTFAP